MTIERVLKAVRRLLSLHMPRSRQPMPRSQRPSRRSGGAESNIEAASATIERIQADITDCALKAPRDGRVQYRVSQAGEVIGSGGRVLNLVDLSDVYMTFFLPTAAAGKGRHAHRGTVGARRPRPST